MRRWILMLSIVALAGCSESQQEAGFAGLAGVAENDAEVPFLQPGPGDRLIFPDDFGPHPQHRIATPSVFDRGVPQYDIAAVETTST